MNRTRKTVLFALVLVWLLVLGGFVVWAVWATLIAGTTGGPDFIQAIASGLVPIEAVSSVEVVEPMIGYMPFTEREYDNLSRRMKIDSPASIRRLLSLLVTFEPGSIFQNHPGTTYRAYLKVNTEGGFFWLYCRVSQDCKGSVMEIAANTRKATNPNSASTYHLKNFSEVLGILTGPRNTELDGAANGSEPIRSETNSTPSGAGSRR